MTFLGVVLGVSAIVMVIVAVTMIFKGRIGAAIAAFVLALVVGGGAGLLLA